MDGAFYYENYQKKRFMMDQELSMPMCNFPVRAASVACGSTDTTNLQYVGTRVFYSSCWFDGTHLVACVMA
jgi:hypothetical protein